MSKYQQFIYKSYNFDKTSRLLSLFYGYDAELEFCETYTFDFPFVDYDSEDLDKAIQTLFFIAGVSYYKAYLAPEIRVDEGEIDESIAGFLSRTYQKGLGEFFYVNNLDPKTEITCPTNIASIETKDISNLSGVLIGLGGGKDSLVSVELLKDLPKVATWSLNHKSQLEPLVAKVGLPHFWVEREWDAQLKTLNAADALNGHIPISAIFSCVGTIVGILSGYKELVVSNESSASEPTLHYQDVAINHQYSKSLDYEKDYQEMLNHLFGSSISYYSLLRPFSELRIAEIFAQKSFDKYLGVFSSCNRAYRHGEHQMFWCGECAKCAFVCLIFTPFVESEKLLSLWEGVNLLLKPELEETYRNLLGIEGDKPLDCVGEVKEARMAMRLSTKTYPELAKYSFDIPENYDYKAWSESSMPEDKMTILRQKITD